MTRTARGALLAILVGAALLIVLAARGAGPGDALRGGAAAVVSAPQRAVAWVRGYAEDHVGAATDERARIAELEQQLLDARIALGRPLPEVGDHTWTAALAAALPTPGYTAQPARVVAQARPQDLVRTLAISAGTDRGVRPGQAVVTPDGAIGFVASAAATVSTVRLITDPSSQLAARVSRSGELGVLRGDGVTAGLTLLDPLGPITSGDSVRTVATADGLVPADLPLGQVGAVSGSAADLTRTATVAPVTDPSTLDRVAVLVPASAAP